MAFIILVAAVSLSGCGDGSKKRGEYPPTMRDLPAEQLAYSFAADAGAPPTIPIGEEELLKPVRDDFDSRRKDDRLLRTVLSPDGQRALALYDTGETQEGEFKIDMYASDGRFLRQLMPTELAGAFAPTVAWAPDGNSIAFIGRKSLTQPTPPDMIPEGAPAPLPTIAPVLPAVPLFDTEQIYLCDRDGFQLRPITTRNGLIYFYLQWSPDSHALVALACREDEWEVRERESRLPAGRPRVVELDGREQLLDDGRTEAGPVWSPEATKIAAAFETEIKVYDAVGDVPTRGSIPLREPLMAASVAYDQKELPDKKADGASAQTGTPVSFNPIVRLAWPEDRALFIETAYVRIYSSEPVKTFQRWHKLTLSMRGNAPR